MLEINDLEKLMLLTIKGTTLIKFKCQKCGKYDTYQLRNLKKSKRFICHSCHRQECYSDKNWMKLRRDKIEKTNLEKHGVKYYTNREKFIKTCTSNNGGCGFGSKKIKEKIRNTNIKNHNNPEYRNTEKMIETANLNGGMGAARKETKLKMEQTLYEKTGYKHNWSIPNERKKAFEIMKQRNKEKYGVENVMQVPEIRAKIHKKWYYDNVYFDSSWELIYYIWLKDNNIKFKYQKDKLPYYYNNEIHYYEVDFTINGKYIEIKGPQFFDKIGKMINIYDRTLDEIANYKYYCMLTNHVDIITNIEPYKNYIINKYGENYIDSFRKEKEDV